MSGPSLRERNRRAAHAEIAAAAMRLFVAGGFEATTVDQIAVEAGVSRRTFFHYFANKEDVVLGDLAGAGETVRLALEARPAQEPAWTALRAAFLSLQADTDPQAQLAVAQMFDESPSLRARHLEKHLRWQELLAPDIQRRLNIAATTSPDPRARALIAAALACLDVAVASWRESGGTNDPIQVFDAAVAAIRGEAGPAPASR